MAKQLQLRRGTTVQHNTFTGAVGEVTIDTDKDVVVVHDGATVGGFPSQKELVSGTNIKTVNSTTLLGSGNIAVQETLVSGTNIKTINNSTILGSGNIDVISAGIITGGTTNQVLAKNSNTDYDTKWYSVQEPLISGTNIKTINSTSLLGSGNLSLGVSGLSDTSISSPSSGQVLSYNGTNWANVTLSGIPSGVITLWSGSSASIPSGWYLCDGNNGTPNLIDRFVVGAGSSYAVGATGGSTSASLSGTTGATTLTVGQMPSHDHTYVLGGASGTTAIAVRASNYQTITNSTSSTGGGGSHTHAMSGSVDTRSPYYALCYIMKA